jgi:hypothetical protein
MDITGFNGPPGSRWYTSPLAGELTATPRTGRGRLHYAIISNTTAAKIYAFVFDNTAASGTLLMPPIPIPANDCIQIKTFQLPFVTGCTVSASTTQTTYTAAGANAMHLWALNSGGFGT